MDYLKNHKNIIKKEANFVKKFIITFLQNENEKGRNTDKAISDLANLFYTEYLSKSLIEKYKFYFDGIINDIRIHKYNYDSNKVDSILKTLENEVHNSFIEIKETFSKHKIEDYEILEKLTYESFFSEILKFTLYQKVQARLENSIPHLTESIKLFYELNNYDDFSTTFLINESEKVTKLQINNIFKKHGRKLVLPKKENQEITSKKNEIENISSLLTNDEKLILLHLCLKQKTGIPMSEQIKLILLSQKISDYSIFYEDSNINKLYNKINKGFNYQNKKEFNVEIINKLMKKIENLGLTKTIDELISIKTEL